MMAMIGVAHDQVNFISERDTDKTDCPKSF